MHKYELMQEKHHSRVRETQSSSKCVILVNLSKNRLYILKEKTKLEIQLK